MRPRFVSLQSTHTGWGKDRYWVNNGRRFTRLPRILSWIPGHKTGVIRPEPSSGPSSGSIRTTPHGGRRGPHHLTRYVDPALVWCWASVADGGPTLNHRWVNYRVCWKFWVILGHWIMDLDPTIDKTVVWCSDYAERLSHRSSRVRPMLPVFCETRKAEEIISGETQ